MRITMKDKVLMISTHFKPLACRKYIPWVNPEIYDINILSSFKCRDDQEEGRDGH